MIGIILLMEKNVLGIKILAFSIIFHFLGKVRLNIGLKGLFSGESINVHK